MICDKKLANLLQSASQTFHLYVTNPNQNETFFFLYQINNKYQISNDYPSLLQKISPKELLFSL